MESAIAALLLCFHGHIEPLLISMRVLRVSMRAIQDNTLFYQDSVCPYQQLYLYDLHTPKHRFTGFSTLSRFTSRARARFPPLPITGSLLAWLKDPFA